MGDTMRRAPATSQSPIGVEPIAPTSTTVDDDLAVLRGVVSDLGWTCEAIASHMGRDESYKSHVSRVLNGERPMSHEFLKALPDDVEAEWHSRLAEQAGRVVVTPAHGEDAVRSLVSGLVGMLAPRLPAKASRMARVELPTRKVATR